MLIATFRLLTASLLQAMGRLGPVILTNYGPVEHYVWRWSAVIGAFRSGYCFCVRCFPKS